MQGETTDLGGSAMLAPDPALGPAIGAERERRRHARAVAGWWRTRSDRFPRLDDAASAANSDTGGDAAVVLIELTADGVRVAQVDARLDRQPVWPDLLLDQILARAPAVRAQRTPLGFEADAWDGSMATALRGVLLPLADEEGTIRYVQAVLSWKSIAPQSGALAAAVACAEAMAAADAPVAWPTLPGGGTCGDRLAVARTWAALAAADAFSRRTSLDAALSAVFDATLLGAEGDLIADVFAGFSTSARRRLRLVLAHAARLGLGAGGLSPLLSRYPGGTAAIARLEVQIRKAERRAPSIDAGEPASVRMRLVPVAADWMAGDRHSTRRELDEGTPWSPACVRAA